jgi:4'-phosphopantetheinyl transferase
LVRGILTELTGRPPLSWAFGVGAFGKPNPVTEAGDPSVQTSLSHTKGFAIAAGCTYLKVGVDAEWLGRRTLRGIVENYFSQEEREKFRQCPTAAKTTTFFEIWTLKEAYTKAIGAGLNLSFDSFGFDIDRNKLVFSDNDNDLNRWSFYRFRIGETHTAALAVEGQDGFRPNVCAGPVEIDWLADLLATV